MANAKKATKYKRIQWGIRLKDGSLFVDHSLKHPQKWDTRKGALREKHKGEKVVRFVTEEK